MTKTNRRANVIAALTLVVTAGVLILAAVSLPAIYASKDNSGQVARGNELASCRADARSLVDDAQKDISILIIRTVRASIERDREQLTTLAKESVVAEQALIDANLGYRNAVRASIERPERFLEECKAAR